jgi:putative heme iron utilization protein
MASAMLVVVPEEFLCECGCGQTVAAAHEYASVLCIETEITRLLEEKRAADDCPACRAEAIESEYAEALGDMERDTAEVEAGLAAFYGEARP